MTNHALVPRTQIKHGFQTALSISRYHSVLLLKASRSLHIQPTACVAAPHTLPVNHSELQNQRVGCVRYARTRLLD